MLTDYFGCRVFPDAIAKVKENYTPEGLILWYNLKFGCMKFEARERVRNDAAIQAALKDPKRAVILNVNDGKHWVLAVRRTYLGLGSSYIVVDPWTGKQCDVIKVYKNITGAAYFVKK